MAQPRRVSSSRTHAPWTDPSAHAGLIDVPPRPQAVRPADLPERRRQAVMLYAHGAHLAEIAREMGVGYETAKRHLKVAVQQIGLRDNAELPAWYFGYTPYSALAEVAGGLRDLHALHAASRPRPRPRPRLES